MDQRNRLFEAFNAFLNSACAHNYLKLQQAVLNYQEWWQEARALRERKKLVLRESKPEDKYDSEWTPEELEAWDSYTP